MTSTSSTPTYINHCLHSDVHSYLITWINFDVGTAMAQAVERRGEWQSGHADGEIVIKEGSKPFPITYSKRLKCWGYEDNVGIVFHVEQWDSNNIQRMLSSGWELFTNSCGERMIGHFEHTPTGRKKTTFKKLGQLDTECRYYYDPHF